MAKKIDVLIYFEHVVRELDACIILKERLNSIGLTAEIVPVHRNRYHSIVEYQPKMVVVPFLFASENDIIYKEFNACYGMVEFINLHHEQFYNKMTKSHFMPKNEVSKNTYHLSWGRRFAEDLIDAGVDENKIIICGNPRTDNYYCLSSEWIRAKIGNWENIVFVPTSFSWAFVDEDYFIKNAKIDPVVFKEKRNLTCASAEIFLKSVRDLAKRFPNKVFVVRPHPFEKEEIYYNILRSEDGSVSENIKIIREGNVYDWIKICDLMIGWITTVSVEASVFNRKNIIYTPIPLADDMKTDFMMKYDHMVIDYNELESIVGNPDRYQYDNAILLKDLESSIGNVDGKVNERLANCVQQIIKGNSYHKSNLKNIARNYVRTILYDWPKNFLLSIKMLNKVRPFYDGIEEDLLSYKDIKHRIKETNIIN